MARPIEPTPVLHGEDAEKLLLSLDGGASDEEMKRREERARQFCSDLDAGLLLFPIIK